MNASVQRRALALIERTQKRARLEGPSAAPDRSVRRRREEEALLGDDPDPRGSDGGSLAQQVEQLRGQTGSSVQFAEAAAQLLARALAQAEIRNAARPSPATLAADTTQVTDTIQPLQQARQFHRKGFADAFLAALGQRAPSLPTLWRLHVAHVLPLEHYLEKGCACADAVVAGAVEAFRRGVLELGEGELGAGISDEVMILPGMFRELLAIVHTGSHFGTAETGRRQPHDIARSFLAALGGGDRPFSELPDAQVLVQLKLLRVAGHLASSEEGAAGALPAQELLQENFIQCLSRSYADASAAEGSSLLALSHSSLEPPAAVPPQGAAAAGVGPAEPPPSEKMRDDLVALFVTHPRLGATAVVNAVDRVIRREETDWDFVARLVPRMVAHENAVTALLLERIRAVFTEAAAELGTGSAAASQPQATGLGRILSAVTLLRFVLISGSQTGAARYKRYIEFFQSTFLNPAAVGSLKKTVLALVRALTAQVPRELALYLKLHISALNPRNNSTPASCREAIMSYISLAKTRLSDLGQTASLGPRSDGTEAASSGSDPKQEIRGFVSDFKRLGAIPQQMFQMHMFRKTWWKLSGEPVLLAPLSDDDETRIAQRQLIEALVFSNSKVPLVREGALEVFDVACVAGDDEDADDGADGPVARVGKLLEKHEQLWQQWAQERADSRDGSERLAELRKLCSNIENKVAKLCETAAASEDEEVDELSGISKRTLDTFCASYRHAVGGLALSTASDDDGTRGIYEILSAFCAATRQLGGSLSVRLTRLLTVVGATELEQQTCDGLAMYLALERCSVVSGVDGSESDDADDDTGRQSGLDSLLDRIPWWKSGAWLHWFLRFGAAYTRAVLSACDALHTSARDGRSEAVGDGECAGYLPQAALLRPSTWLIDRARLWLASAEPSRVLSCAPQASSAAIVGNGRAADAGVAAYRWLLADWSELMGALSTLGVHMTLDLLPMDKWVGYETRLLPTADYLPTATKLQYLRTRVFEVYLPESGAAAICATVLRGLLSRDSPASEDSDSHAPVESVHCFLLLVQELASLALRAPPRSTVAASPFAAPSVAEEFAAAGAGWLLQFVASEHDDAMRTQSNGDKSSGPTACSRLRALMGYCLLLPPALLWGGDAAGQGAGSTQGLEGSWSFIDRVLLREHRLSGGVWSGAMATHIWRGLLHHCHATGGLQLAPLRKWLQQRPRLVAALLTPHWRLVSGATEAMLGTQAKEELLAEWETALYAADGALAPSAEDNDRELFAGIISESPSAAAVALHAVCLSPPTPRDESAHAATEERALAADSRVALVQRLLAGAATPPEFRSAASGEGQGGSYELSRPLTAVQRAAVMFAQLLASGCPSRLVPAQDELSSLAHRKPPSVEDWLVSLRWRLLTMLVLAAPWLVLAAGGEPALQQAGAGILPPPSAPTASGSCVHVFSALLEWQPLDALAQGTAAQVALVFCAEALRQATQSSPDEQPLEAADFAEQTPAASRRLVRCVDRLVKKSGAASLKALPRAAARQLVASVPHLQSIA